MQILHMQSTSPVDGTQMKISTGCLWRDTLTRKPDEAHIRIISKDRKSAQRKMMRGLHSRLRK